MLDPALNLQIHCTLYRIMGHGGMQEFPRYFVTLNGKIIFDWPKDYPLGENSGTPKMDYEHLFFGRASHISDAITDYLNANAQKQMILTDPWGITDIIRAADRRIGCRRWDAVFALSNCAGRQVLLARKAAKIKR
ncbi:MAG TPA: hypothetical protein IAC45_00795 [Candidatus Aphodousia faecavium]|nr:hypothetical protein [Candidatus Aphodousia faecavium]